MSLKIRLDMNAFMFLSISIFSLYSFWYQYAFHEVNGVLNITGIAMLICIIISVLKGKQFLGVRFIFVFLIFALITGAFFSSSYDMLWKMTVRIIRYLIPMVCIYMYIDGDDHRFKNILWLLTITMFFLSLSLLMYGEINSTNAVVLENLNANVFSSFILIGLICNVYLVEAYNSKLVKMGLFVVIMIEFSAIIEAASRRGVLVFVFFILTYIHSLVSIKYKYNVIYKLVTFMVIAVLILSIVSNFDLLSENLVFLQDFNRNNVDTLRKSYQMVAWNLFLQNPLFGKGLGSVAAKCGAYSHSLYFELLACTGILGTIVMLFPMIRKVLSLFRESVAGSDAKSYKKIQSRIIMWGYISMLITGMAVVYIYDANFYVLISVLTSYSSIYETIDSFDLDINNY